MAQNKEVFAWGLVRLYLLCVCEYVCECVFVYVKRAKHTGKDCAFVCMCKKAKYTGKDCVLYVCATLDSETFSYLHTCT